MYQETNRQLACGDSPFSQLISLGNFEIRRCNLRLLKQHFVNYLQKFSYFERHSLVEYSTCTYLDGGVCTKDLPNIYIWYILMGLKVKANTWTWIHFKTFRTSVYISKRFEHLFTFQNVLSHIMCHYVMHYNTVA